MRIFDFLKGPKGPQLTKVEANSIACWIAERLFKNEITTEELIRDADIILENILVSYFPDRSIEADQSSQILKLAYLLYENDKEWLEWRVAQPVPEVGDLAGLERNYEGKRNIKPLPHLTLFKEFM